MSTRILARLIFSSSKLTVGIENVTLSRIPLRYYLDSVTVILTAPSLQMYVMSRAVTEQIVTQGRRLVEFSVSKWLKLTQFHLFTPLFGWKKATLHWENPQEAEKKAVNIYFCAFQNWKCLQNYRRPTMKIPEVRWCLTEISFNNTSQFPGMF